MCQKNTLFIIKNFRTLYFENNLNFYYAYNCIRDARIQINEKKFIKKSKHTDY